MLLVRFAVGLQIVQICAMRFMVTRAWYEGGNGSSSMVGPYVLMPCHAF